MGIIASCIVGAFTCLADCLLGIIGAIADCLECIVSGALISPLGGNIVSDGNPPVIFGCLTGIVDCICDCLCCGCVVFNYFEPMLTNVADNLDDPKTV